MHASWCIYVYNYFIEVHLGEVNFGEIDLLGKNGKQILLVGECKFKNSQFDKTEYEKVLDKIKYIPTTNPVVCVFSLGGFSEYVKENASDCKLISLDDMYK